MSRKTAIEERRAAEARRAAARKRRNRWIVTGGVFAAVFAGVLIILAVAGGSIEPRRNSPVSAPSSFQQTSIRVGAPFPDFRVTDAATGRVVTNASLEGKPTILWFTTSYCVPCQIGARLVTRLEDQIGGKPFNVV